MIYRLVELNKKTRYKRIVSEYETMIDCACEKNRCESRNWIDSDYRYGIEFIDDGMRHVGDDYMSEDDRKRLSSQEVVFRP